MTVGDPPCPDEPWRAAMVAASVPAERRHDALARASAHAPFLARQAAVFDNDVSAWLDGGLAPMLDGLVLPPADDVDAATFLTALRRWRCRAALMIALGDLSGELDLDGVTATLSVMADAAVDRALARAVRERHPEAPWHGGIAVVALGKAGSGELNYSSDIDPVLLFDPDTVPRRARDEPTEAAVRIARRMIAILSDPAAGGHVLRVDLRLRPSPEASPIVLPVDAAIAYYESQALPWEQAAYVRSRACAGDRALGRRFLADIAPFVWRRSLDFRQLREIARVSSRIRDHYAHGQSLGPGFDLKRGRGGIREVEFYAQVHQLIFGGRDAVLRTPRTTDAIKALASADRIDADAARELVDAYQQFRRIEHRLQMIEDRQTHSLPVDRAALDGVARLDGLADGDALIALLAPHVEAVGARYDALIAWTPGGVGAAGDDSAQLPNAASAVSRWLADQGFADPDGGARLITRWRDGQVRGVRSPAAREALEAALPPLLGALAGGPDPDRAIEAFDRVLDGAPGATGVLHLIAARTEVRDALVAVLAHAPVLRDALAQRPSLLEGLIASDPADRTADVPGLVAALGQGRELAADDAAYEALLDQVRADVAERRFALGVDLVTGRADAIAVAAAHARLAEATMTVLSSAATARFEAAHGRIAGGELCAIALGRFGGGELTHASDLDVIFVFTGDHDAQSDGARPLGASHYFNRLVQRIVAAMSVPTAAGPLYDVDTRLRPWGAKGPLAVSVDSFLRYQTEEAWSWEHMALSRARVVAGSPDARRRLEQAIAGTLANSRARGTIVADAARMRDDMARHKPPAGPLDVKLMPGGLVDLEFAVHAVQLSRALPAVPNLGQAVRLIVDQGLAPPPIATAERVMTRMLVALRLMAPDGMAPPERSQAVIARIVGSKDWQALLDDQSRSLADVGAWWAAVRQAGDTPQDDGVRP